MYNPKKPIICKKCGHKVGWVRPKLRFSIKIIFWATIIAIGIEIIAQIAADLLLKVWLKL